MNSKKSHFLGVFFFFQWVNMCKTGRSSGYKSGALNEELSGKEDEMEGSDKENLDYIFSSPIGENPQHILEEIYGLEAQIETKAEEVKVNGNSQKHFTCSLKFGSFL